MISKLNGKCVGKDGKDCGFFKRETDIVTHSYHDSDGCFAIGSSGGDRCFKCALFGLSDKDGETSLFCCDRIYGSSYEGRA